MRRLSWLNTNSVNQARVAVLCEEDRLPWECCIPLYEHQIEFNYLSLEQLSPAPGWTAPLYIGWVPLERVLAQKP
jgi:hypothetical protein